MKKRIISVLLISAMVLGMTGCNAGVSFIDDENGENRTAAATVEAITTPVETEVSAELGDDNAAINVETSTTTTNTTTSEPVESTSSKSESVDESNSKIIEDLRNKFLEKLGIDLYLAAVFVFGNRIFLNFAMKFKKNKKK